MDEAGRHAAFIWAAYAAFALVVAGLVMRAVMAHHAQRRALARLEERAQRPARGTSRGTSIE